MTNLGYRFLLTITATSLLLIIFMVQKGYTLKINKLKINKPPMINAQAPKIILSI
jgi:hypothetical protein